MQVFIMAENFQQHFVLDLLTFANLKTEFGYPLPFNMYWFLKTVSINLTF
jgi:hypothetical protein